MSKLRSLALFVRPILWAIPMGYLAIGSETYAQKPVTYKGVCAISIAFSADSQLLAAGGYKADQPHAIGFVNVWNINKHKSVFVFSDPRNHFKSLAFSPVNHVLAAGSVGPNPAVTTWDVNTGKMQMELAQRTNVDCLALSPDGKKIAIATFDKDGPLLTVLELSSKKLVQSFRGNKKGINAVAFSPNGQLIASAGFDGVVRVVSVKTGEVVASYLGHNSPVSSIAFTPDGKHLISGSMSGAIRLLQVSPKSREVYTFQGPDGGVWSIAVEPTGHWLLLGGFKLPSDKGRGKGVVQIWDLRKKAIVHKYEPHDLPTLSVAISPNCLLLASGSADGTVKVWPVPRKLQPTKKNNNERNRKECHAGMSRASSYGQCTPSPEDGFYKESGSAGVGVTSLPLSRTRSP